MVVTELMISIGLLLPFFKMTYVQLVENLFFKSTHRLCFHWALWSAMIQSSIEWRFRWASPLKVGQSRCMWGKANENNIGGNLVLHIYKIFNVVWEKIVGSKEEYIWPLPWDFSLSLLPSANPWVSAVATLWLVRSIFVWTCNQRRSRSRAVGLA